METVKLIEIEKALKESTQGKWIIRKHPMLPRGFVERPKQEGEAYGVEILGDDDYDTKTGDMTLIVLAQNSMPSIITEMKELKTANKALLDACKEAQQRLEEVYKLACENPTQPTAKHMQFTSITNMSFMAKETLEKVIAKVEEEK